MASDTADAVAAGAPAAPGSSPAPPSSPAAAASTATWPIAVRHRLEIHLADLVREHPPVAGAPNGAELIDLGAPSVRADVHALVDLLRLPAHLRPEPPRPLGTAAAVVSCGALAAFADLVGALTAVRALLRPDGALLFADPTGLPGVGRLVLSSFESRQPPLRDSHLGRDLTAAMREAGLVVDQVHRTRVPGVPVLLRHLAYGRAIPEPAPPA